MVAHGTVFGYKLPSLGDYMKRLTVSLLIIQMYESWMVANQPLEEQHCIAG